MCRSLCGLTHGPSFARFATGRVGLVQIDTPEVYFGVGVVGAAIWELLPPATRTVEEMVGILAAKYRDVSASQIRADCDRFLEELVTNGLVTHVQASAPGDRKVP